jgi:hypothetical protein
MEPYYTGRTSPLPDGPDWTLDEFKILLASGGSAPPKIVAFLPGRTTEGISVVQQGDHAFHLGRNHSMLSRLMVDYLEDQRGKLVCPVCGRMF